ncbi:MAG TPA: ATP-binding protein [Pyrinomonadaceae bacterium]|nr:ATP-binding protein [Pyrinomonadaceae bacterium]
MTSETTTKPSDEDTEDTMDESVARLNSPDVAPLLLSALVESADDAVISKTLGSVITSWNSGAERLFGYTVEEAVGKSVTMLIPADHPDEEPSIIARLKRGERIEHYETVRVRKDGTLVDISLTVSPIRGPDGTIIGASKIARDITARKRTEAQLREQTEIIEAVNGLWQTLAGELDLQRLVQAVTDAATNICDAQFGSFFYNVLDERGESYMLYTLSGVPREAFAHFPMPRNTEIFAPTFAGEGTVLIADVKKDPRYGKNSPYYGMPEGHLPVTSYLAVPVVSRSSEVYGGLFFGHPEAGVFTERTARIVEGIAAQASVAMDNARLFEAVQRARAEAEQSASEKERMYREAQESNRLKDEFLATISHELRTPLTAIMGWVRMLRDGSLDEETAARALAAVDRNAKSQAQLIEDLLDVSRIVSGKMHLNVRPVELTSVINSAVESLRPAAQGRGIRLRMMFDPDAGTVLGDQERLQQVVWNLLSNAIKFTPEGGHIEVRLERAGSQAEMTVSDSGRGISRDFLPHVFERFRQADTSTTRAFGGMGLGLSIVKSIVELHGGTVRVESEGEGAGATFTVSLPLSAGWIEAPDAAENAQQPQHEPVKCPPELGGLKILVVDDEPGTCEMVSVSFEQCGSTVRTSTSAAGALALIAGWRPDVLVADISMPEMDGYELIRRVRALGEGEGGNIPAVALTALARVEDRLKALTAGYQMHVAKPVELEELRAVVASLVSVVSKNR